VPGRQITIHNIADIAGVSAGTVSRVINGRPGVGASTRERILGIVAEHGFTANASAQRLSSGRANTIGVVFPFHASEFVMKPAYPALLGGLGDAAEEAGYDILLLTIPTADALGRLTDAVQQHRVDGIVLPAAGPQDPLVKRMIELKYPSVIIGHRGRSGGIPWVDASHDVACYELTRLMIGAGRRRLAFFNGPPSVSACALRSKGFWSAVNESSGSVDASEEHVVGFEPAAINAKVSELLARPARELPTAIVGASDTIAVGCLEVARKLGLGVPDQLAVSGFDDSSFAQYTTPALSTVRMPLRDTGSMAAQMLFALIEGRPLRRSHIVLPTEIVLRDSTPRDPDCSPPDVGKVGNTTPSPVRKGRPS
jgi:LacI family transcriptional regulator